MTPKTLAALGAAVVLAAGTATLALWPSGPQPQDVQQAAPKGSVLSQGAVEICDNSDGGSGQCAICESVLALTAAPDAGGTVQTVVRIIECGAPYDPGSDIAQPGPIMFGMGAMQTIGGKGNLKGGGTLQTTQARVATASSAVSALDPASLGCACAAADPARTDCRWQGPAGTPVPGPDGDFVPQDPPDPVQCPLATTMRPGTCTGADCVPRSCWETELRRFAGDSFPSDCVVPPDAGAPGPDAGPDASVLLPVHP